MPTLSECLVWVAEGKAGKVRELPEVKEGRDVRMLWSIGHYDGPWSGVCLYSGQKYGFETLHDSELARVYCIVEITSDQLRLEEERHRIIQSLLGMHMDYTYSEFGRRVRGQAFDTPDLTEYSRQVQELPNHDFSNNQVVARWTYGEHPWDKTLFEILRPDLQGGSND